MANVRIKDLTTTAATTASDDFFGVDGTTNGTRKLNAYSPTFGGNVTASGNLTVSGTGGVSTIRGAQSSVNAVLTLQNNGAGNDFSGLILDVAQTSPSVNSRRWLISSNYQNYGNLDIQRSTTNSGAPTTVVASFDSSSNLALSGNLTVSGTGGISIGSATFTGGRALTATTGSGNNVALRLLQTSVADWEIKNVATTGRLAFQQSSTDYLQLTATGNFLLGTTSDTGEKLQVNGTGYFAGALIQLGNGSNDALYRVTASNGKSSDFGDDTTGGFVRANNSQSLRFITAGNIVLTLDSSANATFAGTATAATAFISQDYVQCDATGAYNLGNPATDGTWRFVRSGNNLLIQRRESGAFVTKSTISA